MSFERRKLLIGSALRSAAACRFCQIFIIFLLTGCGDHRVLEEVVEKVYSLEPGANVTIQNRDGAVLVYGSDEGDIQVQCVKKAYSQERLNHIAVEVSKKPGAVSVVARFPPRQNWAFSDQSGTVDCTVVVPATASVSTLELAAGELVLQGVNGRGIHARLGDGRIFARNCFTNLDLTLNRGTLSLVYDWWEQEGLAANVNVGQGNAWLFVPTSSAFHLLAEVAHGKIISDFDNVPAGASSFVGKMKIDQTINSGGLPTIQLRVQKGNIKIAEANP